MSKRKQPATPLDLQLFFGQVLQKKVEQVEQLFDFGEDKEGYLTAKKQKGWLEPDQFKTLAKAVEELGGQYIRGQMLFRVPKFATGHQAPKRYEPNIEDFEKRCVLCDSTTDLVIHHKRYGENLTKNDFVILCHPCHTKYHIGGRGREDMYGLYLNDKLMAGVFSGVHVCQICFHFFNSEREFVLHFAKEHRAELENPT